MIRHIKFFHYNYKLVRKFSNIGDELFKNSKKINNTYTTTLNNKMFIDDSVRVKISKLKEKYNSHSMQYSSAGMYRDKPQSISEILKESKKSYY